MPQKKRRRTRRPQGKRRKLDELLRVGDAPGSVPGELIPTDEAAPSRLTLFAFGPDELLEERPNSLDALDGLLERYPVVWLNVDGLADLTLIHALGERFRLHPLALEDVVHVHQRPKVEVHESALFIVSRLIAQGLETEQVSMFIGDRVLLTFQEFPGDHFDPVRERIRHARGRIRQRGPDYLAYALLDAVVDHYFPVVEVYAEQLERLEDLVILGEVDSPAVVQALHRIKREMTVLRRAIRPQSEALRTLLREESPFLESRTRLFLRDCHDHTLQLQDRLDGLLDDATNLVNLFLSFTSLRMNEIMKVLTIIATVFIPLSFIAGLFGMNFNPAVSPWNMPELNWAYGYPFALGLMAFVALAFFLYFLRKGWVRPRQPGLEEILGSLPEAPLGEAGESG